MKTLHELWEEYSRSAAHTGADAERRAFYAATLAVFKSISESGGRTGPTDTGMMLTILRHGMLLAREADEFFKGDATSAHRDLRT